MARRRKDEEPGVGPGEVEVVRAGKDGIVVVVGEPIQPAEQLADEMAMLGKLTPRERALLAFGLEEAHVLKAAEYPQPDGTVRVVLLTQGGQRLRWPDDEGRVLAQHEKDGTVPGAPAAGIFPAKK